MIASRTCRAGLKILAAALMIVGAALPALGAKHGGAKRDLVPFAVTPFPYHGVIPDKNTPFMDVNQNGRLGHTSGRAGVLWEDETYSDKRVLLYVPSSFNPRKPAVIVLFFHGNQALLDRDVDKRQGVLRQLAASKLNAVLVAPQFAADALDSSAGSFWLPETLPKFLDEAATHLAKLEPAVKREAFAAMPVVIVAYSGGYLPMAYSLDGGGSNDRIAGVVLMDALYGEVDKVAAWITRKAQSVFVFSAFSKSSADTNAELAASLDQSGVANRRGGLADLAPGRVVFLSAGDDVVHKDFLTQAWTGDPLRAVFARIATFKLRKAAALAPAPKPKATAAMVPPPAAPPPAPVASIAPKPTPLATANLAAPAPTTALLPNVPMPDSTPPRNLGAIVPSKNRPGLATGAALPSSFAIELATATSRADVTAKATHFQRECATIVGQRPASIVEADGAFSLRIGPFNPQEMNLLCNKLQGAGCFCNPIGLGQPLVQ